MISKVLAMKRNNRGAQLPVLFFVAASNEWRGMSSVKIEQTVLVRV